MRITLIEGGSCFAHENLLMHVLRGFEDDMLTHINETINPIRDFIKSSNDMIDAVILCSGT